MRTFSRAVARRLGPCLSLRHAQTCAIHRIHRASRSVQSRPHRPCHERFVRGARPAHGQIRPRLQPRPRGHSNRRRRPASTTGLRELLLPRRQFALGHGHDPGGTHAAAFCQTHGSLLGRTNLLQPPQPEPRGAAPHPAPEFGHGHAGHPCCGGGHGVAVPRTARRPRPSATNGPRATTLPDPALGFAALATPP